MINAENSKDNKWYTRFNPGWFALILSIVAIIFALGTSSARIDSVIESAAETRKIADINGNRLTTIEQFNRTLCSDINDIKTDLKDIRKDQLTFYKLYNKTNGKN